MPIDAKWKNVDEVLAFFNATIAKADAAAKQIVNQGAFMVEDAAKNNFVGSHGRNERHVGGNKPNVVTGYLRASITSHAPIKVAPGSYVVQTGPRAIYGRRVELGYNGKGAYPYFVPAVEKMRPELKAMSTRIWKQFLS